MIAPAKFSSERLLPPGDRDFEVYRRIEIEGQSTRSVAKDVGLSQTRVVQIRDEVEAWVAQQAASAATLTKQQRMQVAEYKAGLRLDALYAMALEAFRQSQAPEIVSELAANGGTLTKTRMSQGKTCYLQLAMRIAAQQSRLPITPLAAEADSSSDQPTCDEPGSDVVVVERPIDSGVDHANPPEEDCSLQPAEQVESAREASPLPIAKPMLHVPCSESRLSPSDVSADFARDLFPVQTDVESADWPLLDDRPMTRKQRKRRQRMLAELRNELSTG
jgi:hypothetical protein